MQYLVILLLVTLMNCEGHNVNRHTKLIPELLDDELDNHIQAKAPISSKQYRKIATLTQQPNAVYLHQPGSMLKLTCEGIGAPAPNIRWYKNDKPVYERDFGSNEIIDTKLTSLARLTSTLLVPKTDGQDVYTCVLAAGAKTVKATTIVYNADGSTKSTERNKLAPLEPHILVYYKIFIDVIGNNVVLPCKVRGHPKPHIRWFDNKGKLVEKSAGSRMKVLRSGELVISNLSWADMGEFTCIADNPSGSQRVITFVYPAKAG